MTKTEDVPPDTNTINLIVDACVAIEGLLFPDMADKRIDPRMVNFRLLAWIDAFVMDRDPDDYTMHTADAWQRETPK